MSSVFKKATRQQARLRMALMGPSGAGKTFTALKIATYLGGPIAVFDTERGSASKYAGEAMPDGARFEFDVMEPEDFSPETYVRAIHAAEAAGYNVLIIDSLSHAWMGKGGALDMVDSAAKRGGSGGNSFSAWRDVTPKHNAMVDSIVGARLHVIATMRTKMEHVQEKDERTGRTVIRKIGLQAVQRDGLEYEFDLVADLDQEHNMVISKTRCSALSGKVFPNAGAEVAATLSAWLTDGAAPPPPTPEQERARLVTQAGQLFRALNEEGYQPKWTKTTIDTYINEKFIVANGMDGLTGETLPQLISDLTAKLKALRVPQEAAKSASDTPAAKLNEEERESTVLFHLIELYFKEQGWDENDQARYLKQKNGGVALKDSSLDALIALSDDLGIGKATAKGGAR
jgi:hypothetical protein